MPLVPAKCTQCGASLDVDASQEAAICPHCKTPFITEKAINNYNTTNVTNIDTINADVVNVESSESVSNLSRTAETLANFGEWEKARSVYWKITQMYPFDWRGWYGLLQTNTHNFQLQFDHYEEYKALVEIYERLIAVSKDSVPNIETIKRYLNSIYEKLETNVSNNYKSEQKNIQDGISRENALVKDEVPLEIKEKKTCAKITKIVWIIWAATASLISLSLGIVIRTSWDCLDIEVGFIRFANMDYFINIVLFLSIFMLMIQVIISLVLFCIGSVEAVVQKHSKQKRLTAFRFINKWSIIAVSAHLIFWFINIFFFGIASLVSSHCRYNIDTILFHSKTSEVGACWIAVLLIIIYSVINYVLVAAPMFVTERIGNKKRKAILFNIQHKQELVRLMGQKERLPKVYEEDLMKLKMLRDKHQ